MIERIKEMAQKLPTQMGQIIRFGTLTGLRPAEIIESIRLINDKEAFPTYYDSDRMILQHFKFPDIFLRQTKKAFLSFMTPLMLENVSNMKKFHVTYSAIRHACNRKGIACDLHLCRKVFASHLRNEGIQSEIVDILQGRVSQSVLARHYLVPSQSLKDDVLQALEKSQQQL